MCYNDSIFSLLFLMMPCKAERPLGIMDLQEKEVQYMKPV